MVLDKGMQCVTKTTVVKKFSKHSLAKKFSELGYKVGVEVGTSSGKFAEVLCRRNPNLKLYTIDAFDLVYGDPYTHRDGKELLKIHHKKAIKRVASYNCKVIKGLSIDVSCKFKPESIDFVFIDGSHEFDYVMCDICIWGQKVKKGGIISGHDYRGTKSPPVAAAVQLYAKQHKVKEIFLTDEGTQSWWFEKYW